MSIEARLPDGTVLRFPEGTSDEVIQRTVRQQLGVQGVPQRTVDDVAADVAATPIGGVPQGGPQYSVPRGEISAAAPWTRQLGESPIRGAATILPAAADLVTGVANFGLNAGARGLASLFGAEPPADVDISTNLRGATNRGFDAAASAVGLTPTRPEQRGTALYGLGEGGGSTLPISAGLRVAGMMRAPREATTRMGQVGEQILNNYRYAPGRTLTTDVAAGAGAGAAGQLAQDSGMGALGTAGAALVGGTGAGFIANRWLLNGGGTVGTAVLDRLAPGRMDPPGGPIPVTNPATGLPRMAAPGEIRDAAAVLQAATRNPQRAATNIEQGAASLRAGGVTPPTTGALSDDAGLALFERSRRNQDPAPFIEADRRTNTDVARLVETPQGAVAENRAPARQAFQAEERARLAPGEQAVESAQTRVTAAEGNVRATENAAQRQREALAEPPVTASQASKRLDDILVNQTLRPAQETRKKLYDHLGETSRGVQVSAEPLTALVDEVRGQMTALRSTGRFMDEGVEARINALRPTTERTGLLDASGDPMTRQVGGTVSAGALADVLPDLAQISRAARNAGNVTLRKNIDTLRTRIWESLDQVDQADVRAAVAAVRENENNAFAIFRRGEISEFREDLNASPRLPGGDFDRNAVPPSATLKRFWATQEGAAEKAASLEKFIAASPDPAGATEAITNYVMTDLAGRVVRETGQVDPGIIRQMIFDYRNAGLFDGPAGQQAQRVLQQTLQDVMTSQNTLGNARAYLDQAVAHLTDAQANLKGVREAIDKGPLGLVLGVDPMVAASRVLATRDPMQMRAVTDIARQHGPKSLEAWRASVGRQLYESVSSGNAGKTDAGGPLPISFANYLKTFEENRQILAEVMSPEQMNALTTAARVIRPLQSLNVTGTAGSQTAQNQTMLRTAEIMLKSVYGGLRGGNMYRNMRIGLQTLGFGVENPAVTQIIQRSFFEPELAAYLFRSNPDMPVSGHTTFLRRFLGAVEGNEAAQQE